jgi:alanine racemase
LIPSVGCAREAIALAEAMSQTCRLAVHLKVDTGMGRLGAFAQMVESDSRVASEHIAQAIADEACAMLAHPQVVLAGVYTHFSSADAESRAQTERQFTAFHAALRGIRSRGIDPGIRHAANSAGILAHPQSHLDMVRAGIAVYGLSSSAQGTPGVALRQAMSLKARIAALKWLPTGSSVGYGETFRSTTPCLVATVPIGYADGFDRQHSNRAHLLIGGYRVPVIGRVCMDFTMVDVSHVPGVAVGDEVVIYGRQGQESIAIDEVAQQLHTISYEVTTSVAARVRRVHVGSSALYPLAPNRLARDATSVLST